MTRIQEIIAYIVVVILAGLLAWFGWSRLYDHIYQAGMAAARAEMVEKGQSLRADHDKKAASLVASQKTINEKVSADHDQAIADVRRDRDADIRDADRRGGLRVESRICSPGTAPIAETARAGGRDEEATGTVRLPQQVEADLWAIAGDADEVTEQLRACQSWIVKHGFYGQIATN